MGSTLDALDPNSGPRAEVILTHPNSFHSGKIISIPSMEVDFWGVKSIGCENLHATEVKCSNIPQKSVKAAENSKFSGYHSSFPVETTFWSKFFHNTDVNSEPNFPWKWKPQNFALTFISLIFRYEILYAKYVDLLDKLKEVK
jgi:hypothetical protein